MWPIDLSRVDPAHHRILQALNTVPHGETTTYGTLAHRPRTRQGRPRRVGAAMARNPVAILLDCHRVIGATGTLTGFAGGLDTTRALLDLENREREPA